MGNRSRKGEGADGTQAADETGRLNRGADLLAEGKPEAAERLFRSVLEGFADSAVAHALLAIALADQKRGREAMGSAADALALNPHLALAHAARACALEARGLPWEAEMEGRQALALGPTDPNRHSDLAGMVGRAGRYGEALDITARGLALNPQHMPSIQCRALALVSLDRPDEAQEVLAAALLEAPELARLHASLGLALEDRGDRVRAAEEFHEAIRLDDSISTARKGLGRLNSRYRRLLPTNWRGKGR